MDVAATAVSILDRIAANPWARPVVLLMCGVAGSGKTTLAQHFETTAGLIRLSVDGSVLTQHGRFGVDYVLDRYAELSEQAGAQIQEDLVRLLHEKRNVVVDLSFWSKSRRKTYKN